MRGFDPRIHADSAAVQNGSDRERIRRAEIEGHLVMGKKNSRIGSSFEIWLEEKGIRGEVISVAIARQIVIEIKKKQVGRITLR